MQASPLANKPAVKMAHGLPWLRIFGALCFFLFVPAALLCVWLGRGYSLTGLHLGVATAYFVMSLVMLYQSALALHRRRCEHAPVDMSASLIVAAYLPNEQGVIVETLMHMLGQVERPQKGFEVILAYNTPEALPIEADLRALARNFPELRLLRVHDSKSKAENVNEALKHANGEMIAIFDADHQPLPDCLKRASRWLANGYEMVQGRSAVRNPENFHSQIVAAEFETIYGVGHTAGSLMSGSALFCGSNGYWRAEAIKALQLDSSMLTEDIDLSMRAALAGYRMVHDRSIVSTELATTNFVALWAQRSRWARGWLEVTLRHQVSVWRSAQLSLSQKLYFTLLLGLREVYNHTSFLIFPLMLAYAATGTYNAYQYQPFVWASAFLTFATGPIIALIAARNAHVHYGRRVWASYVATAWIYAALKSLISLVAAFDFMLARRAEWVVTPRAAVADAAVAATPEPIPAVLTSTGRQSTGIRARNALRKNRGHAQPERPRPSRAVLQPLS